MRSPTRDPSSGSLLLACALMTACADGSTGPRPEHEATPTADRLFSLDEIPSFSIELSDEAIAALSEEDPWTYVVGTFSYGDRVERNVGVRLKGHNTLTTLSEKPSFKVKFNKFEKGRRFFGLETLTLNNLHADPSMMHEHLAYSLFRRMGLPASRTGYARVEVNGEDYGLYLNLETVDDEFLSRNFEDPKGNLYEAASAVDVDMGIEHFEQDEGADSSRMDLEELKRLSLKEDLSVFFGETSLDTDAFLGFTAAEHAVGHWDGYMAPHNYYLYYEPAADRWTFVPWGLDQTLVRRTSMFEGGGFLSQKCFTADECLERYATVAGAAAAELEALEQEGEMDAAWDLIEAAASADPRRRYPEDEMAFARDELRAYLEERPAEIRKQLECFEQGEHVDHDGDGYGPCFEDCDDQDPGVNVHQPELCDGIDNDCSGYVDDSPECECPAREVDGDIYYFCDHGMNWTQARSFCVAQGNQLAILNDASANEGVWQAAQDIAPGKWAIGLSDRVHEGVYLWVDGAPPQFTAWGPGEPIGDDDLDCVALAGSDSPGWVVSRCSAALPFVCADGLSQINPDG